MQHAANETPREAHVVMLASYAKWATDRWVLKRIAINVRQFILLYVGIALLLELPPSGFSVFKKALMNKIKLNIDYTRSGRYRPVILQEYSKSLNRRQIPAEMWFRKEWARTGMSLPRKNYRRRRDRFNYPVEGFIPDVINFAFRYVIEIDEPHHENSVQKEKDLLKDNFFKSHRFTVVRVKAYDEASFKTCVETIKNLRNQYYLKANKTITTDDFLK